MPNPSSSLQQSSKIMKKTSTIVSKKPSTTLNKKQEKKYVTEGMVDYVTLLRSRRSGSELKKQMTLQDIKAQILKET